MEFINAIKRAIRFFPSSLFWLVFDFYEFKRLLIKNHNIGNLVPYKVFRWHVGFYYFIGIKDGKKIFVKLCKGKVNTIDIEVLVSKCSVSCHYPKFISGEESKGKCYITEFVEGISFENVNFDLFSIEEINQIIKQSIIIIKDLRSHRIIHRDIRPENPVITKENQLILIDFGSAIIEGITDTEYFDSTLDINLNRDYRLEEKNKVYWDDAYSFYKVFGDAIDRDILKHTKYDQIFDLIIYKSIVMKN